MADGLVRLLQLDASSYDAGSRRRLHSNIRDCRRCEVLAITANTVAITSAHFAICTHSGTLKKYESIWTA